MTQSTLVDSRAMTSTPPRGGLRSLLRKADYERAFDILERCDSAPSLPDFKEQVVNSLGSVLGLKHVSFFAGATFHTVFDDKRPLVEGSTSKMFPEYQDRWSRYDLFGTPAAVRQLTSNGVSSLSELTSTVALPAPAAAYVRHFLVATWGMESATALRLELPGGHIAMIGMFDPAPDRIGPSELATLRLLSRQLSAIARGLPVTRPRGALAALSERQRQVVRLVADGFSNAQIAEVLSLAEDSVKKYVSRILNTTGCRSRTELALLARSPS